MLFDSWPERYDRWFETPLGIVIKACEQELVMRMLNPVHGEQILDAGCGTGVFTLDILKQGSAVVGIDLSLPMLKKAICKSQGSHFSGAVADILELPFRNDRFDKVVSITALEFIKDAVAAARELFRVTKSGGAVVVATLNSLSTWAERRKKKAQRHGTIFSQAIFRSPEELLALSPLPGIVQTAVHFPKGAHPEEALELERDGRARDVMTGAFVAARWKKP